MLDQEVRLADGAYKRANALQAGDTLVGFNGAPVPDRIKALMPGGVQPCVAVDTSRGRCIRVSAIHPILVGQRWLPAATLLPGDPVTVVAPHGASTEITVDEAALLGYLVADGGMGPETIHFTASVPEIATHVRRCCRTVGGELKALPLRPGKAQDHYLTGLMAWARKYGIANKTSYEKRVPLAVLRGTPDIAATFLAAYFDCDGHVRAPVAVSETATAKINPCTLTSSTVNEGLARDIQELWSRFGAAVTRWPHETTYKGHPYTMWYVKGTSASVAIAMAAVLWPRIRTPKNRERLRVLYERARDVKGPGPKPEVVEHVTRLGDSPTIAVEMETTPTFVIDGLVTALAHRALPDARGLSPHDVAKEDRLTIAR
jgi:hypothetical protein